MATDSPPIEDVIADMADDALAETIEDIGAEAQRLARMASLAQHELTQRMVERGATVLDTEHWEGKLTPGAPVHQYDDEKMEMGLRSVLTPEEYALIWVHPPPPLPRRDKRYLNELAKRGGAILAAIDAATTTTRGSPRLTLERKS